MSKRTLKKKPPPVKLRITHKWPPPKPDDREQFVRLVQMLLRMGS
jgi:hypothetical protein